MHVHSSLSLDTTSKIAIDRNRITTTFVIAQFTLLLPWLFLASSPHQSNASNMPRAPGTAQYEKHKKHRNRRPIASPIHVPRANSILSAWAQQRGSDETEPRSWRPQLRQTSQVRTSLRPTSGHTLKVVTVGFLDFVLGWRGVGIGLRTKMEEVANAKTYLSNNDGMSCARRKDK